MTEKAFLKMFTVAALTLVILVSTLTYIVDPLFFYRNETLYKPQYKASVRYQMPGLIKNQDYDTVLIGTSMVINFKEEYANKKLNTKTFNAALPASTAKEQSMVAQLALREQNLQTIFWEINFYSFAGDPDWVLEPEKNTFPMYMYDQTIMNDVKYLFNYYSLEVLLNNLKANITNDQAKREIASLYKFGDKNSSFKLENVKKRLENIQKTKLLPENEYAYFMLKSFDKNVIPIIEENPNVQFNFFYSPYPIAYHVTFHLQNSKYLEEKILFKRNVYERLKKYKNVSVYDFQDEQSITFALYNYLDPVHYYSYINNDMLDYMVGNKGIQTNEENEQKLADFKRQVEEFELSQLNETKISKK